MGAAAAVKLAINSSEAASAMSDFNRVILLFLTSDS
jgi:hypothetical protein